MADMLESDQRLEASKEAVLAIGRMAQQMAGKSAKGNCRLLRPELLQVLLRLPVGRAEAAALTGPSGDMSTADEDVKRGLEEASITASAAQLRKREAELLYEVFVVYLRILRQRHLHGRELLGAVLTGLARWGQQVNVELLLEILAELRLLVKVLERVAMAFCTVPAMQYPMNVDRAMMSQPVYSDIQMQSPIWTNQSSNSDSAPESSPTRSSKGPISKLQEFVQSSKAHPLPSSCAVLQWSHENRMAGSSLQFRATTSFLLDGVPHHVLGGWWPSKKQSQRDAAERALAFFIGVCGQELAKSEIPMNKTRSTSCRNGEVEVSDLENFVAEPIKWNCRWETQENGDALCKATVEFTYLGVPHVFAGKDCTTKAAARSDTAKRVLWYLHCPGYQNGFEVEQDLVKSLALAIPEPSPGTWPPSWESPASPTNRGEASPCSPLSPQRSHSEQAELLERKTTVMRLQNRLQKIFARQLTPGKSVWCWRYDKNEEDQTFQASVSIALLDRTFSGGWATTHQAAQMEACNRLTAFLEEEFKS
ncbi:unnamed protein product [Effrenium voratum]|nr:unnamed protein product [Effrenium voratum]